MSGGALGAELVLDGVGKVFATGDGVAGGVQQIDLVLRPGSFFTLLGPSGCGKTTTLRCIAGLEQPDRGVIRLGEDVFFDGAHQVSMPMDHRRIGMVFQSYAIWPHMTVFENVAFPLRVARDVRHSRAEIRTAVEDALRTVELAGLGDRSATRLSGGQQQRVALARAIVRRPRLLLLDEPLSNLDAALREEMRTALKLLQQRIGVTTVYVTHDQSEALDMSDLIAVMRGGRVVQLGTPQDIYFRPQNSFVASFVGAANLLPGRVVGGGGGCVEVRLASGAVLRCAGDASALPGMEVIVGVRPEAMTLVSEKAIVPDGGNRLVGEVVTTGFLGSVNRYGIKAEGQLLQATGGAPVAVRPGSTVAMQFPIEAAVVMAE